MKGIPAGMKELGPYAVECMACQQPGIPMQLDARGFLVVHPRRAFGCRVASDFASEPARPQYGSPAESLFIYYLENAARRKGEEAEAEFWQWLTEQIAAPVTADLFAHESTSMFRSLEAAAAP